MISRNYSIILSMALLALLAGCVVGPAYVRPTTALPTGWIAPVPHQGNTAELKNWWASWGDPVLLELIDNAQKENPNVAIAAARIDAARATVAAIASPTLPNVDAKADANRGRTNQFGSGVSSSRSVSLDALWELDCSAV
jgi:outer membrane protein, multidrug efflux system